MQIQDPPLPTQVGRYRIVRVIGQGAMGRVLLAHDTVLDRDVALKYLRGDLGLSREQRAGLVDRMRQEARASARVSHPNLVMLHDMGEDDQVGLYLVFEYAEGQTLKERLGSGALPPHAVAELATAIGEALTTAHASGVVHRDIKPENIILTRTGPKLADFGIAKIPDSTLTRDGGLLGTPAYSAPEAITNGDFSPSSDQFSLAATLWEALAGRRAFPGSDAVAVASRIAIEEPPRIHAICGVDPHVDTVLARGLSKNPSARFDSCEDFGAALSRALCVSPRSTQVTLPERFVGDDRRPPPGHKPEGESRSVRIAVGGVAVGALLVFAAFQVHRSLRPELPLPPLPVVPPPSLSARPRPPPSVANSSPRPTETAERRPRSTRPSASESSRSRDAGVVGRDAGRASTTPSSDEESDHSDAGPTEEPPDSP